MAESRTSEENSGKIFAGYLSLQGESYEFIARTIAMHNWLKEAYGIWEKSPDLSAEELHQAWRPAFSNVYRHLFAAFLRPYRLIMGPFGEFFRSQIDSMSSGETADACMNMLKAWGEDQNQVLKSFAGACDSFSRQCQHLVEHPDTAAIDAVCQLTPFGLLSEVADEEMAAQFEAVEQMVRSLGEGQFMFPKSFVLHLQKALSTYPKAVRLAQRYESMFRETWESATKRFAFKMKEDGKPEFKVFFDTFRNVLAPEYDALLRSPEFIEVQTSFTETVSDLTTYTRRLLEAQAEMFPALPFATVSQIDTLARNAHADKKRIDALERKLRAVDRRKPESARIGEMEQRIRELEAVMKNGAQASKTSLHHAPARVRATSLS